MTVAASIQVGESGPPGASLSPARSAQAGAESFRSGWQSLLASMGAGASQPGKAGTGGTSAGTAQAGPSAIDSPREAFETRALAEPVARRTEGENSAEPTSDARGGENRKGTKAHDHAANPSSVQADTASGAVAMALPTPVIQAPAMDAVRNSPIQPESLPRAFNFDRESIASGEVHPATNQPALMADSGHTLSKSSLASAAGKGNVAGRALPVAKAGSSEPGPGSNRSVEHQDGFALNQPGGTATDANKDSEFNSGPEVASSGVDSSALEQARSAVTDRAAANLPAPSPIGTQLPGQELQAGWNAQPNPALPPDVLAAVNDRTPSGPPAAMAPIAGRRDVGASTRVSGPREPTATHSIRLGTQAHSPVVGQAGSPALDSAAVARVLGDSSATGIQASGNPGGPPAATPAPGSRETFAALDQGVPGGGVPGRGALDGSSGAPPTWTHAGSQHAEAGFEDPALGWVGVRADGTGTQVHAAVLPGSAEAAVALGGHLPGLTSYLEEQHLHVASVTVAVPEGRSIETGAGQGGNQSMQQETGQGSGQSSSQALQPGTSVSGPSKSQLQAGNGATAGPVEPSLPASGGLHISVMA